MTRRSDGRASITRPRFPRSLPVRICTVSPFFTFIFVDISEHLGSQADDLHEVPLAELPRDRAEDARPARVGLRIDEDGGVLIEADESAVVPAVGLLRPHDDRTYDLALLDRALGRGRLHGSNDHVAHPRVAPVRAAEHADAEELAGPGVVSDAKTGLLLDHLAASTISWSRQRFMRDSGRVSTRRTTSPSFASLRSSWAWRRVLRLTTFLYRGCSFTTST